MPPQESESDISIQSPKRTSKNNPTTSTTRYLTCQCRPKGLVSVIKSLNQKQQEDVKEIGFGGLLQLSLLGGGNRKMLTWLVENFNDGSRKLTVDNFHSFSINADDIYDVFMIPRNEGVDVTTYPRHVTTPHLEHLRDRFGIKANVTVRMLRDVLIKNFSEGGSDFQRVFALYSLASFLAPASNSLLRTGVLKSLVSIHMIPKLDWCKFVLEELCKSVKKYKIRPTGSIGGCVLLLQIVYFHRMIWRGVPEPMSLPLIKHWPDKKVTVRCKQELEAGGYGLGELSVGVYPLTVNGVMKTEKDFIVSEAMGSHEQHEEIRNSLQRDADELLNKYLMKLVELAKLQQKGAGNDSSSSTLEVSDSQELVMDEHFFKYIDDLAKNYLLAQKLDAPGPRFELFPSQHVHYDSARENYSVNKVNEEIELDEDDDIEDVSVEELSAAMDSVRRRRTNYSVDFENVITEVGYVSKFMTKYKKLLSSMPLTSKEVLDFIFNDIVGTNCIERFYRNGIYLYMEKDDILSMKRNCQIRQPILTAWFLEVNQDSGLDGNRSRFVFDLEHSTLLQQIMDGQVSNVSKTYENFEATWNHWLSSTKDTLLSAQMIFIPMGLNTHYSAVVINFVDSKVQYLDNRRYDSTKKEYYFGAATLLKDMMIKYLEKKNHPKFSDASSYEFENVVFRWTTSRIDNDCGVYMMHHIKYFNGMFYTSPDMNKAGIRLVMRAEICVGMLLSKLNENRGLVIEETTQFYRKKPALLQQIAQKKKDNALKFAEKKKCEAAEELKKLEKSKLGKRKRKASK